MEAASAADGASAQAGEHNDLCKPPMMFDTPDKKKRKEPFSEPEHVSRPADTSKLRPKWVQAPKQGTAAVDNGSSVEGPGHYDLLRVPRSASLVQIQRAYRHLALQTHPGKGVQHDDFVRLMAAFDILSDRTRRATYDLRLETDGGQDGFSATGAEAEQERSLPADRAKTTRGLARAAWHELLHSDRSTWPARLADTRFEVLEAFEDVRKQMLKLRQHYLARRAFAHEFPREVPAPECLQQGWKCIEFIHKMGQRKGVIYTRFTSPWGKKGFKTVRRCIVAEKKRNGKELSSSIKALQVRSRMRLTRKTKRTAQRWICTVNTKEGCEYWVNCEYNSFRIFTRRTSSLRQAIDWHIALCAVKDTAKARMCAAPTGSPSTPLTQEELVQLLLVEPDLQLSFCSCREDRSMATILAPVSQDLETAVLMYRRFTGLLERRVDRQLMAAKRIRACSENAARANECYQKQFQLVAAVAQELERRAGATKTLKCPHAAAELPRCGQSAAGLGIAEIAGRDAVQRKIMNISPRESVPRRVRRKTSSGQPSGTTSPGIDDAKAPELASQHCEAPNLRSEPRVLSLAVSDPVTSETQPSDVLVRPALSVVKANDRARPAQALVEALGLDNKAVDKLVKRLKELSAADLKKRVRMLSLPPDQHVADVALRRTNSDTLTEGPEDAAKDLLALTEARSSASNPAVGSACDSSRYCSVARNLRRHALSIRQQALRTLAGQHGMRVVPQKNRILRRGRTDPESAKHVKALEIADRCWRHHTVKVKCGGQSDSLPSTMSPGVTSWCQGLPEGVDVLTFFEIFDLCRLRACSVLTSSVADQELAQRCRDFSYEPGLLEKPNSRRSRRGRTLNGNGFEHSDRLIAFLSRPRHMAKFVNLDLSQAPVGALEDQRLLTAMGSMHRLEKVVISTHGWGSPGARARFVKSLPCGTDFECIDARGVVITSGKSNEI